MPAKGALVHQSAARFCDDPLGANQERHAAVITDAEARSTQKIRAGEIFLQIKRCNIEASAAQFEREVSATGGGLQDSTGDRRDPIQKGGDDPRARRSSNSRRIQYAHAAKARCRRGPVAQSIA